MKFELSREDMMLAVQRGVADGIFRIATNASDMPCADFFEAIKQGAEAGMAQAADRALNDET